MNVLPLVRIVFVCLLLGLAGLTAASTLGSPTRVSQLPLVYLPEVQILVAPPAAERTGG